jgi:hypothetical protein
MAAAAAAAESSKAFTPEDYLMSDVCDASDPFICVLNRKLFWSHLALPEFSDAADSTSASM